MPETPVLVVTVAEESPRRLRGAKLFRAISRKLTRKSHGEDQEEADDSSSSSSSGGGGDGSRLEAALKKMMRSLTPSPERKPQSSRQPVKKILRQPTTYTYVRGMSGLPTIRVPRPQPDHSRNNYLAP